MGAARVSRRADRAQPLAGDDAVTDPHVELVRVRVERRIAASVSDDHCEPVAANPLASVNDDTAFDREDRLGAMAVEIDAGVVMAMLPPGMAKAVRKGRVLWYRPEACLYCRP
jgi:hypothetical protein